MACVDVEEASNSEAQGSVVDSRVGWSCMMPPIAVSSDMMAGPLAHD